MDDTDTYIELYSLAEKFGMEDLSKQFMDWSSDPSFQDGIWYALIKSLDVGASSVEYDESL